MIKVRVGVISNRFGELAKAMPGKSAQANRESADDLVAEAKRRAPFRTGELRDSIAAKVLNQYQAEVTVGAPHGPFLEYGTRFMPAQPYLTPAAEVVRPKHLARVAAAIAELG